MAVYPDRIVLKNSTDGQAAIETAIGTGGTDAITQGEIVVGVETNSVKLYTKAGDGSIVTVQGGAGDSLASLTDVNYSSDLYFDEVTLLLRGEGVNNGTTFTDESSNELVPNFTGGTFQCVTSTDEFKYGSSSIYQPSSGYITYADNSAFHVGSADFTIETWFLVPTGSNGGFAIGHRGGSTVDNGWALLHDSANNNFKFYWSLDGTTESSIITSSFTPTANTWYHVAFVRNGTAGTIYIDGVSSGTGTVTGTIYAPSFDFTVGAFKQNSGYFYRDEIYLDEVRLTKAARYASDFTPSAINLYPGNGQVLAWVERNDQWEAVDKVNALGDLSNVKDEPSGTLYFTTFDRFDPTFTDPIASAVQGTVGTTLGTYAYKILSTEPYGDGSALFGFLDTDARYDVVNFRVRSTETIDTNNRLSLGGNKQELTSGAGFALYTRNNGFGFFCNNSYQEIGVRPTMNADTWYEITYVLDWGSAQRTTLPTVSLWVDGAIAVNQESPSPSYTELTGGAAKNFRLAYSSAAQSNQGDKYWDDIRVATSATIPWAMSDTTITNPKDLMDAAYKNLPNDGEVLSWVASNNQWEPVGIDGGSF